MTEEEVRKVVVFVRSHQPRWNMDTDTGEYDKSLYNRRDQLTKGSREYDEEMDELYIKEFMNVHII